MNILVTGGAGYIGSAVAADLVQAKHNVTVLDNLIAGHREAVPPGAELVVADLREREQVLEVFAQRKLDAVMHFAAFANVGESMQQPEIYFRNNLVGSVNLLEAMAVNGVKKIVFSSTCATYGIPAVVPIVESTPQDPVNPYGHTKKMVEDVLEWYARLHGFHYACLRYFNASGGTPERGEDHTPETHLVPIILQVALGQREFVSVFGDDYDTPDGTCIRDYIHILDLSSAHLLALEKLAEVQRIHCNLGSENGNSVLEVIECARQVTGHPIPIKMGPRRPGDPPRLVANNSHARAVLGWQPKHTDIRAIVQSAWDWHSHHPQGYRTQKVPS